VRRKPWAVLTCSVCGTTFEVEPHRAGRAKQCSWTCKQRASAAKAAVVLGDALRFSGEGKSYVKLNGRHMHRVVMETKLGRPLLPGEVVHHIDGNKRNNDPENLELTDQPTHTRHHWPQMMAQRKAVHGY
jgi:hypothetical protein